MVAVEKCTHIRDSIGPLKCFAVCLQDTGELGWWRGEIGGRQGVFPDNFVAKLSEAEREVRFHRLLRSLLISEIRYCGCPSVCGQHLSSKLIYVSKISCWSTVIRWESCEMISVTTESSNCDSGCNYTTDVYRFLFFAMSECQKSHIRNRFHWQIHSQLEQQVLL